MTIRRAVAGDEAVLRALRIEALTVAPQAFDSTLERELARTPAEWARCFAPVGEEHLRHRDDEVELTMECLTRT